MTEVINWLSALLTDADNVRKPLWWLVFNRSLGKAALNDLAEIGVGDLFHRESPSSEKRPPQFSWVLNVQIVSQCWRSLWFCVRAVSWCYEGMLCVCVCVYENIRCPSSRITYCLCGYRGLACTNTMSHRGRTEGSRKEEKKKHEEKEGQSLLHCLQ